MNFTIYYNRHCVKCHLTSKILSSNSKNKVTMLPITDKKRGEFQAQGFYSAPVVFVRDGFKLVDFWSDFNAKKINQYK